EMMARRAACLYEMGRETEALEAYQEAEEFDPTDGETLTELAQIYMRRKDYEKALEYANKIIKGDPGSSHGFIFAAICNFELNRDRDALDAINRAINTDGGDLSAYMYKLRIFIRNGVYQDAHELIDFLHDNGVKDFASLEGCEAMLFEQEGGDEKEALEKYLAVHEKIEKGEYVGFEKDIYYRIASITASIADKENKVARKEILSWLEKGLKFTPDDPETLDYKAWLLKKEGELKESLEIYKGLEKLRRNNMDVERQIAEIYYADLDHRAAESLEYYEKLLEADDAPDNHFYAGMCCYYMDDYDNAIRHFLREQELEPDVLDGYYRLSVVYMALGRLEDALSQALKVIDIVKDREEDQSRYYAHLAKIYRRMRRPYDALDAVREALDKYGYAKANSDMHEICLQFGLWDEAEKVMRNWKANRNQIKDWSGKDILRLVLKGEKLKAKLWFTDKLSVMDQDDKDILEIVFGSTDKKFSQELRITKRKIKDALDRRSDLSFAYGNYAFALLKTGDLDGAKENASIALTELEKEALPNNRYAALYETKKARNLALTGRMEEAKHILKHARTLPLCENCKYPACKDADIFEVEIAIIEGKYKTALEMCEDFAKQWPDETDFIILKNYLITKGLDK
ncbi:MAG: tetratricopeptide repeat protein, partial [Firmicutes bacterium]|nr:tetratricopeptide repeat protein [Bacillota bacterium]